MFACICALLCFICMPFACLRTEKLEEFFFFHGLPYFHLFICIQYFTAQLYWQIQLCSHIFFRSTFVLSNTVVYPQKLCVGCWGKVPLQLGPLITKGLGTCVTAYADSHSIYLVSCCFPPFSEFVFGEGGGGTLPYALSVYLCTPGACPSWSPQAWRAGCFSGATAF